MQLASLAGWVGGSAGILYLLNWIITRSKRVSIKDKVVLITGANSGLGKSCAHIFYKAGCRVILAGRNLEKLKQVVTELTQGDEAQDRVRVLQLDLDLIDSIPSAANQALQMFGKVDVLINNAGISYRGQAEDTDIDVHRKVMTVNYFSQIALTKALLPSMLEARSGHIVAVSSLQGRFAIPYRSAYAASKHALQAFFDSLRSEVKNRNVHVCVISPGYIRTNLSMNAVCGDGSKYGITDKTTATGMSPDYVARLIRDAVETQKTEVLPISFQYKIILAIRVLWPSLFFYAMKTRANKQRKNYMKRS